LRWRTQCRHSHHTTPFREATPDEIAEAVIKVLPAGALSSSDHALIAAALLENFWVVPR